MPSPSSGADCSGWGGGWGLTGRLEPGVDRAS